MRRVVLMLDVTEAEAEQIVDAIEASGGGPTSDKGVGIREAFEGTRASAQDGQRGSTLGFRSPGSGALGGKTSAIAMSEASAS
jgi:hypothetical protein